MFFQLFKAVLPILHNYLCYHYKETGFFSIPYLYQKFVVVRDDATQAVVTLVRESSFYSSQMTSFKCHRRAGFSLRTLLAPPISKPQHPSSKVPQGYGTIPVSRGTPCPWLKCIFHVSGYGDMAHKKTIAQLSSSETPDTFFLTCPSLPPAWSTEHALLPIPCCKSS